jgi:hypothetical protein
LGGESANSVGQPPTADAMRPHPIEKPGDLHAAIAGGSRLRVGVRMTESNEEAVVHLRFRRPMPNVIARGIVSPKAGAAKAGWRNSSTGARNGAGTGNPLRPAIPLNMAIRWTFSPFSRPSFCNPGEGSMD